jgi:hypothetical protein
MDYQYPSGPGLRNQMVQSLFDQPEIFKTLEASGFSEETIRHFREALRGSPGLESVDKFLERRPALLEVGRAAIAWELAKKEEQAQLLRAEAWYPYLWKQLECDREDFGANRLSIVTFNYDRSLEQFFFLNLTNGYGLDPDKAAKIINIPIIHVHGSLGPQAIPS